MDGYSIALALLPVGESSTPAYQKIKTLIERLQHISSIYSQTNDNAIGYHDFYRLSITMEGSDHNKEALCDLLDVLKDHRFKPIPVAYDIACIYYNSLGPHMLKIIKNCNLSTASIEIYSHPNYCFDCYFDSMMIEPSFTDSSLNGRVRRHTAKILESSTLYKIKNIPWEHLYMRWYTTYIDGRRDGVTLPVCTRICETTLYNLENTLNKNCWLLDLPNCDDQAYVISIHAGYISVAIPTMYSGSDYKLRVNYNFNTSTSKIAPEVTIKNFEIIEGKD